jgi:DNA-binding IclR family transcriptional regulator
VQREGYALDNREFHPAIACVAVPVFDHAGLPIASISASEHADSMSRQRQQMLRKALLKASQDLKGRVSLHAPLPDAPWPQMHGAKGLQAERRFGT